MTYKVFSIRDAKAEIFNTPWYKTTHGEAERDFRVAVNDEKTSLNQFPEDFDLYYLGEYDDNEGLFKSLDTPQHVVKAISVLKPKPQPTATLDLRQVQQ